MVYSQKNRNDLINGAAMSFITFTEKDKVNIKLMDKQHKTMISIVNKIYKDLKAHKIEDILISFEKLIKLLKEHFEYEERLMKETEFEGYYSHKLEHDRMLKKTIDSFQSLKKDKTFLKEEHLVGIKNWFFNHLELSDKKCGAHFVKMGFK